jgi:hypothetical protein
MLKKQIRKSFFSGKNVDIRRPTRLFVNKHSEEVGLTSTIGHSR